MLSYCMVSSTASRPMMGPWAMKEIDLMIKELFTYFDRRTGQRTQPQFYGTTDRPMTQQTNGPMDIPSYDLGNKYIRSKEEGSFID